MKRAVTATTFRAVLFQSAPLTKIRSGLLGITLCCVRQPSETSFVDSSKKSYRFGPTTKQKTVSEEVRFLRRSISELTAPRRYTLPAVASRTSSVQSERQLERSCATNNQHVDRGCRQSSGAVFYCVAKFVTRRSFERIRRPYCLSDAWSPDGALAVQR